MKCAIISLLLRLFLGGVFVWSGIVKVQDPLIFADSVAGFQLLPFSFLISLVAICLPIFEILLGGVLVVGIFTKESALLTAGLCGLFMIALAQAMVRGLVVDCGCFGETADWMKGFSPTTLAWISLIRATILCLVALALWCVERRVNFRSKKAK